MLKRFLSLVFVTFSCIYSSHPAFAGPLTSAEVTKIINRVSVIDPVEGRHPATIREVIKDDLGLQTGERSRSELLFQDNTLTRIGAETFFSFKTGTRDMTLEKGSMLLQVPKGLGGATIHTAAVTAAITGTTIMMEYVPKSYIKVLVLEGSLRLSRNGRFGDSLILHPGKMVIMRPDAKRIPDPIDVDLDHAVRTSSLVNFPDSAPLPSMPLIQAAIGDQTKQFAKNNLVPTNLAIGHGTNVTLVSNDLLSRTNGVPSLPMVGNVLSTLGAVPGSTATTVANDLLGATSTVTTVAVSSSTQILSLLDNAMQNAAGVVTVAPAAVPNAVTTVLAAAPAAGVVSPTVNNVANTIADTAGSITTSPSLSNSRSATLPVAVTPVLGAVTVSPTSVPTETLVPQNSAAGPLPLGLGH